MRSTWRRRRGSRSRRSSLRSWASGCRWRWAETGPFRGMPQAPGGPSFRVMARGTGTNRVLALIIAIVGVVMVVAGGVTYYVVHDQLADEKITVSDDADFLAGDKVDG